MGFDGLGDEGPHNLPGDLVFVVEEVPHDRFTRKESNLISTYDITLKEALCGKVFNIQTLDGRFLTTETEVVYPGYVHCIQGEGMPILSDPTKRGDLILQFNVAWPRKITPKQKKLLTKAL